MRTIPRGLSLPTLLVLAACSSVPSGAPSASSSGTPSGEPPSVELVSDGPVIEASTLGDFGAALPAAFFIAEDGTHHAWVVGFGDVMGDQKAFHLTSPDGRDWTLDSADPFVDLGLDLAAPGPIPSQVLPLADGTWAMYLWGSEIRGSGSIWRATAPSLAGPWVADGEPVLNPGDAGTWSGAALDFPGVVATDGGYLMIFSAAAPGDRQVGRIGMALSGDGISWQPAQDPVIEPGLCGEHDAQSVGEARLIQTDAGYLVLYAGYEEGGIGMSLHVARSADGMSWSCASSQPVLSGPDIPGGEGLHTMAAALHDGEITLLVESLVDGGSEDWLATFNPGG